MATKDSLITARDTFGYALGDLGCQLTFGLIGAFLTMFYTDVLGITMAKVAVLMLAARLFDASTDPLWGAFVDRVKQSRHGRFRPWLLWGAAPLAVTAVLMFTNPGLGA